MRFLRTLGMYGIANLVLFCGLATGQEMLTVPAEVVAFPDMIVHHAKLVTMDDHSFGLNTPVGTIAEAMAVRDGKVMAIGTNSQIQRLAGPRTDQIDAKGRMVMPSFINTHNHAHNAILADWQQAHPEAEAEGVSIYQIVGQTDEEFTSAIKATVQYHVEDQPPGRIAIIEFNRGPDGSNLPTPPGGRVRAHAVFLSQGKFTKQMLDPLSPDHPILLRAHPSYVANTEFVAALERIYGPVSTEALGMDEIGRVRETAAQYRRNLPSDMYFRTRVPLLADIVAEGLLDYAARGITTYVSHMMGERFIDAFNVLVREKRMPIRFAWTHWAGFATGYADSANFYRRMGDLSGMGSDYFWNIGVGLGSIDSGLPRMCSTMEAPREQKALEFCQNGPGTRQYESTKTAIAYYQRVNVGHAAGDKGIDYFMDAVEEAMQENPAITLEYIRSRRLTSDHCTFYPRISALPRMGKLGMIISCGAGFRDSMQWIGPGKYPPIYVKQIAPVRSAIEAGVMVTSESNGFAGSLGFLTRKTRDGVPVSPEEAVDRNTLLKMMTSWPARFVLKEDLLGSLEPGKFADFLVLNGDYFAGPPEAIAKIYPLMTVVGGKILVLQEEFARELGRNPAGPQIDFSSQGDLPDVPGM
ncbi:MAG: amidohydrolase family protein [Acidobacteria bacterium]|nr:amidohydrolase family protein [Acidobacteriota bacterium]